MTARRTLHHAFADLTRAHVFNRDASPATHVFAQALVAANRPTLRYTVADSPPGTCGPARVAVSRRSRLADDVEDSQQRLLDVSAVAERLNVTERFVRRLVAERRIPIQKVGRHVRFRERDVDAFLEAGYHQPSFW